VRLGVYLDTVYVIVDNGDGRRISTSHPLVIFFSEVGGRLGALTLFGRTTHRRKPDDYLLSPGVELVELPYYENLRRFDQVVRATAGTTKNAWRGLSGVDAVWVFGPHPFALLIACLGLVRGKHVFLGVRQDSVRVLGARLRGHRWTLPLVGVRVLAATYRLLARRIPTMVQGAELAQMYGGSRPNLFTMTESVVAAEDLAERPHDQDWSGQIELLTVGRIDPEKNPYLLVDAISALEQAEPGRYRLTWVGRGPLEEAVRRRAQEAGVAENIDFRGYVPVNAGLLDLYRCAHAFVHVSLSEGMPKVLIEALACATPIVATDVGGVRDALDGGKAGILVPPRDVDALVDGMRRLVDDEELRARLVGHGLRLARELTVEAEAERVVQFMTRHVAGAST
jgi:glycosyltransferase involved in cell wall biosynthesis